MNKNDDSQYNHYPNGISSYLIGSSKTYPGNKITFSKYTNVGHVVLDSRLRNKGGNKTGDMFVTSGMLDIAYDPGKKEHCAHTSTHNFRMLIRL